MAIVSIEADEGQSVGPDSHQQENEHARFEQFFTITPTARVDRLRAVMMASGQSLSIDRARIETRVMKETDGEPMLTRRAKVFAAVARELPIQIASDELIVGCPRIKPNGVFVSPANGPGVEGGLDHGAYAGRLSEADQQELRDEIIPYWKGPEGKYENTPPVRHHARFSDHLKNLVYADPDISTGIWWSRLPVTMNISSG